MEYFSAISIVHLHAPFMHGTGDLSVSMRIIPVWPVNAVLLTILLQTPPRLRAALMGAGFCGLFALNLAAGDPFLSSSAVAFCDIVEVALAMALLVRAGARGMSIPWRRLPLNVVLWAGLTAPALSAALAACLLAALEHAQFIPTWGIRFMADALGMLLVLPLSLMISAEDLRRLEHPRACLEAMFVLGAVAVSDVLIFEQTTSLWLFLAFPALLLAAFRMHFIGSGAAIFLTASIAMAGTRAGSGPLAQFSGQTQAERIFLLQLFLATAAFTTLAVGAILHQRDALRREIEKRVLALQESYEREKRISKTFQEAALDQHLPRVPGISLDALYQAGNEESLVGGDWYDAFTLPDGRIALSIGDVSGSGLHAAVIMASVRQSIRTAALIDPEPLSILCAVDRIVRSLEREHFVTAFVGVLDPTFGELTYACAGHPSPLLRKADGTVEAISRGDLPLGLRQEHPGESFTRKMEPGSLLLLYTDGLTESEHDILAGERKLADALGKLSNSRHPAQEVYQRILGDQARRDDVAILTVTFSENTREHESASVPCEFTVIRSG